MNIAEHNVERKALNVTTQDREHLAPLESSLSGLSNLNACVAEDFLQIAALLQSSLTRAREISARSRAVTTSSSTQKMKHAIGMLQDMVAEAEKMSEFVACSDAAIAEILDHVSEMVEPVRHLSKMRSRLQTVTVLSRIECERIVSGSVDLSHLPADIETLAEEVNEHIQSLSAETENVAQVLRKSTSVLNRCASEEERNLANMSRHAGSVLEPLISRVSSLESTSMSIDEQYTVLHKAAEKIVMSLQSEDIVRQRVEHVIDALNRVAQSAEAGRVDPSDAAIIALQWAQVSGAMKLVDDSLNSIRRGVDELQAQVNEVRRRTESLVREIGSEGQSLSATVSTGLQSLSPVLRQCSESIVRATSLVQEIVPAVERMTKGTNALEDIESSVQLISLNAAVKTARLGEDGAAMDVIARDLNSVANNSKCNIRAVLGALSSTGGALQKIVDRKQQVASAEAIQTTASGRTEQFAEIAEGLESWTQFTAEELQDVLGATNALAEELAADLKMLERARRLPELFKNELEQLDRALETFGITRQSISTVAADRDTQNLMETYSMQAERDAHSELFGNSDRSGENHEAAKVLLPTASSANEFGDDIELF